MKGITNPITSVLGLVAGGLQLAAGGTSWKQVLAAVAVSALGVAAGDGVKIGK